MSPGERGMDCQGEGTFIYVAQGRQLEQAGRNPPARFLLAISKDFPKPGALYRRDLHLPLESCGFPYMRKGSSRRPRGLEHPVGCGSLRNMSRGLMCAAHFTSFRLIKALPGWGGKVPEFTELGREGPLAGALKSISACSSALPPHQV